MQHLTYLTNSFRIVANLNKLKAEAEAEAEEPERTKAIVAQLVYFRIDDHFEFLFNLC